MSALHSDRHPGTAHLMRWLVANSKLPDDQFVIANACHDLAEKMLTLGVPDGAELTAGLRKLLEAKDCFVRASLGDFA
jgi:hypothetical protein